VDQPPERAVPNKREQASSESALLSVVVPAFREASTIVVAMERLLATLDRCGYDYEVILVSDGNTDGTEAEARRVQSERLRVLHYEQNQGKGFAQSHGVAHAKGDLVAFIDADLDIHPGGIARYLEILHAAKADAVVASKIHPESNVAYPWPRRLQSRVFRLLVELLFRLDVSDTQTGLKLFRREVLDACLPFVHSYGFAFDLELLVLANDAGFKIVEGPVELDFQFSSTTGVSAVIDVVRDVVHTARRRRRERREGVWIDTATRASRSS